MSDLRKYSYQGWPKWLVSQGEIVEGKNVETIKTRDLGGWIATPDNLPDFHVDILFCTKHGVRVGRFYRNSHKFITSSFDKFYKDDVSYWMYLPEPPKC